MDVEDIELRDAGMPNQMYFQESGPPPFQNPQADIRHPLRHYHPLARSRSTDHRIFLRWGLRRVRGKKSPEKPHNPWHRRDHTLWVGEYQAVYQGHSV